MTNPLSVFPLGNKVGRRPSRLEKSKGADKPSLPAAAAIRLLPEVASVLQRWPPTAPPSANMVSDFLRIPWEEYSVSVVYRDAIETQLTLLLGGAPIGRLTVLPETSEVSWAPCGRPSHADRLHDDLRCSPGSFPWLSQDTSDTDPARLVAWLVLMMLSLQYWHDGLEALRFGGGPALRHQMRVRTKAENPGTALEVAPDPRLHLSTRSRFGIRSARTTAEPSWKIQFMTVNPSLVEVIGQDLVQELLTHLSSTAERAALNPARFWERWCSSKVQSQVVHVSPTAPLITDPGHSPGATRSEKQLCVVLQGLTADGPVPRELLYRVLHTQGWAPARFQRALDAAVLFGNALEFSTGGELLYDLRPDWSPEGHDHYRRVHRIYGPHHAFSPRSLAVEIELAGQIEYHDLMDKLFPADHGPGANSAPRSRHSATVRRARAALHSALELGIVELERSGDRFVYRATPLETLRRLTGICEIANEEAMPAATQAGGARARSGE